MFFIKKIQHNDPSMGLSYIYLLERQKKEQIGFIVVVVIILSANHEPQEVMWQLATQQ